MLLVTVVAAPAAEGVQKRDSTYDYVVVGGGTGGLAIAARYAIDQWTL